jgi:hypothetical protein
MTQAFSPRKHAFASRNLDRLLRAEVPAGPFRDPGFAHPHDAPCRKPGRSHVRPPSTGARAGGFHVPSHVPA